MSISDLSPPSYDARVTESGFAQLAVKFSCLVISLLRDLMELISTVSMRSVADIYPYLRSISNDESPLISYALDLCQ